MEPDVTKNININPISGVPKETSYKEAKQASKTDKKVAQAAKNADITPGNAKTPTVISPKNPIPATSSIHEGLKAEGAVAGITSKEEFSEEIANIEEEWTDVDSAVQEKWADPAKEVIASDGPKIIQERVKERRSEIHAAKEDFRNKGEKNQDKQFVQDVETLMGIGSLKAVDGGKSGVYFLSNDNGEKKYVVKPIDEEMLTLNNPKSFALPYSDADNRGRPTVGVPVYSGAINEKLAGDVAKEMEISRCTTKSELMIVKSDTFHDITDGIKGPPEKIHQSYGTPDKEKLCVVQEFIPNSTEVGELLLTGSELDQEEFMAMSEEEQANFQRNLLPQDIDQDMFEEAVILSLVCGETDGNAGNFMVADTPNSETGKREVYKIDNAASFPEENTAINSGTAWVANCAEKPLSNKAREKIRSLDSGKIEALMREAGKSEIAIEAMKDRVIVMKHFEKITKDYPETAIDAFSFAVESQFWPEETEAA